jgi:hypothetical protein
MDGAAGAVDGFELVAVWGAGFTGGCFPKSSSTSGMRAARGLSPEFSIANVGFPHHRGHQRQNRRPR